MDFSGQFENEQPGSVTVAFRLPITATAAEIRRFMDERMKGRWRAKPLNSAMWFNDGTTVQRAVDQPKWRVRMWQWATAIKITTRSYNGQNIPLIVNFDDPKDAMLFKLTWG